MSSPDLRVLAQAPRSISEESGEAQLTFFEAFEACTIVCLPMLELHGVTFARIVSLHRPAAAFDLRSHPYFERPSLDRTIAFRIFEKTSTAYLHKAFDLRPPKDQEGLWAMRSKAVDLFPPASQHTPAGRGPTIAVLINRRAEIAILGQALRQLGTGAPWLLIDPTA